MSLFNKDARENQLGASLADRVHVLNPPSPLVAAKGDNATDDAPAIQAILNYCASNNLQPYFAQKLYKINSTIVIPNGCKKIDFNYAIFNFYGAAGTYCISGGSTDGSSGGYLNAVWRNLYINGNGSNNGMDVRAIKSSYFENFFLWNCNVGLILNNSWQNMFHYFFVMQCTTGIDTGGACNAVAFSALSVSQCTLGMKLGTDGSNPAYGVTIGNGSAFQSNTTAIELHTINQASIINTYFEANTLIFNIANNSNANYGVNNFSVENCIIDLGLATATNLMVCNDTSNRPLYAKFTNNRFQGNLTGLYFEKGSGGLYGNWKSLIFKQNTMTANGAFTNIFPANFNVGIVECDIPYLPTINNTGWTVKQTVKIFCLGNNEFELSGIVAKVSGQTQQYAITGLPNYFQAPTANLITVNFVPQTVYGTDGSGNMIGSLSKMARVENQNNQFIYIFTADNTDTSPIYLTGVRWRVDS